MNIFKKAVLLTLSFFLVNSFIFANDGSMQSSNERIEKNLLAGLNSENRGLQLSCAYFLGEIKSDKAVIPLLSMLHNGNTESERIMAALSLYKINTELAIYAVKESARFDDSERVRKMCTAFYHEHLLVEYNKDNNIGSRIAQNPSYGGYELKDFDGLMLSAMN